MAGAQGEFEAQDSRHFIVGGGIAGLAAASCLIREVGVPGHLIRVFDDGPRAGGALDGSGTWEQGFLSRGGRMFEANFVNTFDLLDGIGSVDDPDISVTEDILAFNAEVRAASNCRLVAKGRKAEMERLGLSAQDIVALNRLLLTPERRLEGRSIGSWFGDDFFETNFWVMWSTMFSFQPWHALAEMRRYMRRFIHLFPGLTRIKGILRTRYNQYDSLIVPLRDWLAGQGVVIETGKTVAEVEIGGDVRDRAVTRLRLADGAEIGVAPRDRVYLTLGSMVDGATYGDNETVPAETPAEAPSWRLWRDLAARQPGFGRPEAFCEDAEATTWMSFTVTMDRAAFRDHIETFTGNETGTGGLVTIRDSAWLLSFVMFRQPHFRAQPEGCLTFWGYGLRGDRVGDHVAKPMWRCTGEEILTELCGQLGLGAQQRDWFAGARVRTCRMPFITSQFMPRRAGDRPDPRPPGAANFALMGQFVELPLDTVFTVEYSVRSARAAVFEMTGQGAPLPVVRTDHDPRVLLRAAKVLMG